MKTTPQPKPNITNIEFLQAIFAEQWVNAHVTAFSDDPSNIANQNRAKCWAGNYYHKNNFPILNTNQFYTVSIFAADPETGRSKRRKANFAGQYVVVLDDVEEKLPLEQVYKLPPPSFKLRTSPGSYQWGYILQTPCTDRNRLDNLTDQLITNGLAPDGNDPGMKGVTRYVRLPEGVNTKAKRIVENGGTAPRCEITEWNPFRKFTLEQLAEPFNVILDAARRDTRTGGAVDIPDNPLFEHIKVKSRLSPGRYEVTCPWVDGHTGEDDSGSAIFTNADFTAGFQCHHGHDQDKNIGHVIAKLEEDHPGFKANYDRWVMTKQFEDVNPVKQLTAADFLGDKPLDEISKKVVEVNKTISLCMVGGNSRIIKHNSNNQYTLVSVQAQKDYMRNQTIITAEGKPKQLFELWMGHPSRKTFEGIEFSPTVSSKVETKKFNLWTGFKYDPMPYKYEEIKVFINYINQVVCDDHEEHFNYLIKWIAYGFQHPDRQAEVAIVLQGGKGTGKSTLGKILMLLWGTHSKYISNSKHLTSNFNSILQNCCCLVADEAYYAGDKAGEANLKALITEPELLIEQKGIDPFQVKNCLKIIMCSNKDWVVPSSADERRFFCLNVEWNLSPEIKSQYFTELYKAMDDDNQMAMLFDYLQKFDLSGFNIRNYPETDANKKQREYSLGVIPLFLLEACERGYFVDSSVSGARWFDRVRSDLIMEGLKIWGRDHFKNSYERPGRNQLQDYLRKLGLKSNKIRNTATLKSGQVVVQPESLSGYEIGSSQELTDRINHFEKIIPKFDFM